jgi:hypothetical protein
LSIKDRNARVENRRMIVDENSKTIEETRGMEAHRGVIPETIGRGVPGPKRVSATLGMAFPMPGAADGPQSVPTPPQCGAVTKKGVACKAHPIIGEPLCVGHSRQ